MLVITLSSVILLLLTQKSKAAVLYFLCKSGSDVSCTSQDATLGGRWKETDKKEVDD